MASTKKPEKAGKTVVRCDFCGSKKPIKYCNQCVGILCYSCARCHTKGSLFSGHSLTKYTDQWPAWVRQLCQSKGYAKCATHKENLDTFCTECALFLCIKCKGDHENHSLRSATSDNDVYFEATMEFINTLKGGETQVKAYKDVIEGIFKAYGKAIDKIGGWEKDLLEYVKQKAKLLRDNLTRERAKYEKILKDLPVDKIIESVEREKDKLPTVRQLKEGRSDMLSKELANTQQMVEKLKGYQQQLSKLIVPTVEQILSNDEELDLVKAEVDGVFDADIRKPLAGFTKRKVKLFTEIVDTGGQNRFIRSNGLGRVQLHKLKSNDIKDLSLRANEVMEVNTAEIPILSMATLTKEVHVAVNDKGDRIHLLDSKCKVVSTTEKTENHIYAVDYLSRHRFVILEVKTTSPYKTYIRVMSLKGKKMVTDKTIPVSIDSHDTYPYKMCAHKDQVHFSVCSNKYLYKVNIKDETTTKYNLASNGTPHCLVTDSEDNVIVSSTDGKIRLYDDKYEPHILVDKVAGNASDMMIRDGKLFADTGRKIFIYA